MCEDFFCSRCKGGWVLQYKGGTQCLSNCPTGFYRKEDWYSDQSYCDSEYSKLLLPLVSVSVSVRPGFHYNISITIAHDTNISTSGTKNYVVLVLVLIYLACVCAYVAVKIRLNVMFLKYVNKVLVTWQGDLTVSVDSLGVFHNGVLAGLVLLCS